nr:putative reverse transcriptase domain-containing protein [Tanacetum cinerariifolium]
MSTARQGMSLMEIDQIIAQRVTNAIKAIIIYEERTRVTRDSMDQVARQGAKKNKTYVWGDKQKESLSILKEKLCSAPVLALLDGPNDFVVYCDASNQGFGCVLMQRGKKELNMRQRWWIELLSDYECEIKYHPVKEIIVADALSRKGRLKLRRVRTMSMTIHFDLKTKNLEARGEASKDLNAPTEWLRGLEIHFERRDDVHLGANKMYYDLKDLYWWPGMKRNIYSSGYDAIWVIVDRLTKSAHFLPIREDYKTEKPTRIYALGTKLNMSIAYHPETDDQSERIIQTLEDMLRACVMDFGGSWDTHLPLVEFSYNNSYHKSIKCAPFKALYGCKCISPVIWAEVGESQLIGPKIVQETTEKIIHIKKRLKTARSRQKNYADKKRKPFEFKVSPWKGVVQFGKKGKLAPWYVGPFEIVECVGPVAYRLRLPQELSCVHDVFYVSNLKKCLADSDLQVSLEEINLDDKLYFVKEPVEIVDRQVKKLKRSWIPIVKVRWDS